MQEEQGCAPAGTRELHAGTAQPRPSAPAALQPAASRSLSSCPPVRGDFWVSKDTTFHGKAIIRGGVTTPKLTANTCSCALDRYYHGKAAGTTGTR